jgi:hypothetical protein
MAWIDYQKAFNSVPNSWIIKSLELIRINNKIIYFTKDTMSCWKTRIHLYAEKKLTETEDRVIHCGMFQGDSLSPLLFCINLMPLTEQLNMLNTGYKEHTTIISYLLYIDNLKLIGQTEEEILKQMQTEPSFMISI